MRDSNHRSVLANRPVVTITSTVYDRRALDLNANIPLINSLNHLTYLTSNSGKVRETIANDGALERLVSILHGCHIPLFELLELDLKHVSKHKRAQMIWKQKKLAMCAWKWTLAFQCLVLTGTRGTEQIRKKVVLSGVIPVLATVLDNYLIYHKNYDHLKGTTIDVDISSLNSEQTYKLLRKDSNETYAQYMEYITGKEALRLSDDEDFITEELSRPSTTLASDFADIWSTFRTTENEGGHNAANGKKGGENNGNSNDNNVDGEGEGDGLIDKDSNEDSCFIIDDDHKLSISIPRDFFLGRIVPKQDDVIWSLQLLAFISKYTYMKQQLQNVELIESLSFRSILERVKKRVCDKEQIIDIPPSPLDTVMTDTDSNTNEFDNDPFVLELQKLVDNCKKLEDEANSRNEVPTQNPYRHYNISISEKNVPLRIVQERHLVENFEKNWDYHTLSTDLDDETWSYINSKEYLNLFPLVERCTVNHENPHDMVYWSSVIMRNSCRKNEVTGVRQCANFSCGKWEDYPRQFAKCRRCKRTKYCSRECQLKAWTYHRYWCHEVGSSINTTASNTGANTPNVSGHLGTVSENIGHGDVPPITLPATTGTAVGIRIGIGMGGVTADTAGLNVGAATTTTTASTNTDRLSIVDRTNVISEPQGIINNAMDQDDELITTDDNDNSA